MRQFISQTIVFGALIISASAFTAEAQGNWQPGSFGAFRFRAGLFEPRGDSQYWQDTFEVFTGSPESFRDLVGGVDYVWMTSGTTGLMFGSSFYNGKSTQAYLDWVDADGRDISHTTSLKEWDLTATFVWRLGRHGVVPYLGIGGGFNNWRLEESGYFIDFADPDLPVVGASYRASGWTFEAIGLAGIDVPLGYRWSFFIEGRYRYSQDELADDFSGFGTIDLSGGELAFGFSWRF